METREYGHCLYMLYFGLRNICFQENNGSRRSTEEKRCYQFLTDGGPVEAGGTFFAFRAGDVGGIFPACRYRGSRGCSLASVKRNEYEAVVAVHTDKVHLHAHVIINSVNMVTGYKFQYRKGDWKRIYQPITNELCEEYEYYVVPAEYSKEPLYFQFSPELQRLNGLKLSIYNTKRDDRPYHRRSKTHGCTQVYCKNIGGIYNCVYSYTYLSTCLLCILHSQIQSGIP